ncbi:MAG: hypothetical protein COA79_05515 [Planctomycetota bacterium]|nr:MAG: hypothetical protein COA79_05515 [Planctomycetota bacterium]
MQTLLSIFNRLTSIITIKQYKKILPNGSKSSMFLRVYLWWNIQLTPFGKAIFIIWMISGLPAAITLERQTYMIGLGLGILMSFNYFISYFLIHLKANVKRLSNEPVHAGETIEGVFEVEPIGWTSIQDLEVFEKELPYGISQENFAYCAFAQKNKKVRVPYKIQTEERGRYDLTKVIISTFYPFGIVRKVKEVNCPTQLIVYPKLLNIKEISLHKGRSYQLSKSLESKHTDEENEYIGNKEYVYGDSFHKLDHKAWARLGFPITKVYKGEYEEKTGIFFLPATSTNKKEKKFETAISVVATIGNHLLINRDKYNFVTYQKNNLIEVEDIEYSANFFLALASIEKEKFDQKFIEQGLSKLIDNSTAIIIVLAHWNKKFNDILVKTLKENIYIKLIFCSSTLPNELSNLQNQFLDIHLVNQDLINQDNFSL